MSFLVHGQRMVRIPSCFHALYKSMRFRQAVSAQVFVVDLTPGAWLLRKDNYSLE